MWRNYFITSFRTFQRNSFFVSINVLSLGLAFSIGTIGFFNFRYNHTFNKSLENSTKVFKVIGERPDKNPIGAVPLALANQIKTQGIQSFRYQREHLIVKKGDQLIRQNITFIDPELLNVLNVENQSGRGIHIPRKNEIILSRDIAIKLFGTTDPSQEIVEVQLPDKKTLSFTVIDIIQELPENISFDFSAVIHFENYEELLTPDHEEWSTWIDGVFIFHTDNTIAGLHSILETNIEKQNEKNKSLEITSYRLMDLVEWPSHESNLYMSSFNRHLHPASVMGTVSSAIAVLLLAFFNFINTSIAMSGKRLREIATRKVLGGNRRQIIVQFLMENIILIIISMICSILISMILIPGYNSLFPYDLIKLSTIPFTTLISLALGLLILTAIIAGAYPAFYISKFPTLSIFREKVKLSGKNYLAKTLLTIQFLLCFYNLMSLGIFVENSFYQETFDRGYDLEEVINIPLNSGEQFDLMTQQLHQDPKVRKISGTYNLIGFNHQLSSMSVDGVEIQVAHLRVGPDYLETLGVRLAKGNLFHLNQSYEDNKIVINKFLESQFGRDMIGEALIIDEKSFTVIGVVDDFNLKPIMLDNKIPPCFIQLVPKGEYKYVVIKTSDNDTYAMNRLIEKRWNELFPNDLYGGIVQESVMDDMRDTNFITININLSVAICALLITSLGLYTLISLTIQRRIKEFGVRKVLGATKTQIANLLGRELYFITFIAAVLGLYAANHVIGIVLDIIFAYHIEITMRHFLVPVIGMLIVMGCSIGLKIIQTANMNPTNYLRQE